MTEQLASTTELEQPLVPGPQPESAEETESGLAFLTEIRQKITNELKLSFTLPDPRKAGIVETGKNLALKATGAAGVVVGRWMFEAGEHGQILHSPGETEQAFHHMREAAEGVGISTIALGAMAIFVANRMRSQKSEEV